MRDRVFPLPKGIPSRVVVKEDKDSPLSDPAGSNGASAKPRQNRETLLRN